MTLVQDHIRQAMAWFLCLCLVIWSATPSFSHAPAVFETLHDHLEMIEDHGHSHGFEEDLLWAMHGHSHDVADHDHTQAFLLIGAQQAAFEVARQQSRPMVSVDGPGRMFRIERPPRV